MTNVDEKAQRKLNKQQRQAMEASSVGIISHRALKQTVSVMLLLILVFIFIFPIYLAVISSFKTENAIYGSTLTFPTTLYLDNYREGLRRSNFGPSMLNSCIVVFPAVAAIVLCASMGGYTIARNSKKSKFIKMMDTVYLASLMIPFTVLMIPVYKLYKTLHLSNNLFGYGVMLVGTSIAYASFLYIGFVKTVPRELEEAAYIDGAGPYYTFFHIVLPLLMPITATVTALHVMWLWNDFNIALILLQKEKVRTLTVKQYYFFGEHTSDYGQAFAASILCMIPVLAVFISMQKYIVSGISAGAVKT